MVDVYAREQQVGADPHRAPGEVPRRAGIGWLVLALLLVAAVLLLRRQLAGPG